MKNSMQLLALLTISVLLLSGCSSLFNGVKENSTIEVEPTESIFSDDSIIIPQMAFHTHQLYSDYTDAIATQLFEKSHIPLNENPVIVTSFGYQNRSLENNHQLSYLLSESIANNLQPFGVKTIAMYQHSGLTYLNATGLNFNKKLKEDLLTMDAEHILTGVIIPNERGLVIHAKIIEITSMHIISAAEKFIPYYAFN